MSRLIQGVPIRFKTSHDVETRVPPFLPAPLAKAHSYKQVESAIFREKLKNWKALQFNRVFVWTAGVDRETPCKLERALCAEIG